MFLTVTPNANTLGILAISALLGIIPLYILFYSYNVYLEWETHFARQRLSQRNRACHSNKDAPDIKTWDEITGFVQAKAEILGVSMDDSLTKSTTTNANTTSLNNVSSSSISYSTLNKVLKAKQKGSFQDAIRLSIQSHGISSPDLRLPTKSATTSSRNPLRINELNNRFESRAEMEQEEFLLPSESTKRDKALNVTRQRGARTMSFKPETTAFSSNMKMLRSSAVVGLSVLRNLSMKQKVQGSLSREKAKSLHMDHVYLPFSSFLWASWFVTPNAVFSALRHLSALFIRIRLHQIGWVKPKPHDPAETVGRLLLEQSLAIYYQSKTKNGTIAGFFFTDFSVINRYGQHEVKHLLQVDIDLRTKKMIRATLDKQTLTAMQTIILLYYNLSFATHVKLHSFANWGINCEPEQKKNDPFHARNSLVTVLYNYFGYTRFCTYFPTYVTLGMLDMDFSEAVKATIDLGIEDNIWSHPNIHDLVKHSRLVNFIIKCRAIFLKEFEIHKKRYFPGVHGEAMFIGTVLHSLDHMNIDINIHDELWFDTEDEDFRGMAQVCRIVKSAFVKDLPFLTFHKRFKDSGHPFYETVYEKAARIDRFLADNMDTGIIK